MWLQKTWNIAHNSCRLLLWCFIMVWWQIINSYINSCRIFIFECTVPLRQHMDYASGPKKLDLSNQSLQFWPLSSELSRFKMYMMKYFYFIHRKWVWTHCSIPTCPLSLCPLQFCAIVKLQLWLYNVPSLFMSRHLNVLPQHLAVYHNWPSCRESPIECVCIFTSLFSLEMFSTALFQNL